jgi:hypothetical protein
MWGRALPIPECVFPREDPPDDQRNDTTDEVTPSNETPGDVVPVFSLPHERGDRISSAVAN